MRPCHNRGEIVLTILVHCLKEYIIKAPIWCARSGANCRAAHMESHAGGGNNLVLIVDHSGGDLMGATVDIEELVTGGAAFRCRHTIELKFNAVSCL